ncbi:MAG TPA: disease resistance protein, partial [Blastocatellia bacterium]
PRVFYDRYYEAELSRPNLDTYLQKIYHDDSELVVVVLCKEYDEKEWCGLEFRAIRDLIKQRRDDEIMFVRVADGDVKGVFGIDGYVDAKNRPATEIAQVICDRLALL